MTDEQTPAAAAVPASPAPVAMDAAEAVAGADTELLGLIDRLAELLHRSDLLELEVESGGTGLILRKAVAQPAYAAPSSQSAGFGPDAQSGHPEPAGAGREPAAAGREPVVPATPSIKAPLTGIFYASPAPGSAPYVQVGGEVAVGQVIGLIEAMKLFNEIKSDLAGRVVRVLPESGALVKAKQPLIEVEPL